MRRIYIKKSRHWIGIAVFIMIILSGVLCYSMLSTKAQIRASKDTLESLTNTQQTLIEEQEKLQEELERYQSGEGMSEDEIIRIAREKLGLVFEEEIIITPNE